MPKRLIPLFPLQLVVFPRTHLPLHIFEERYKEMVGDAIRDGSEFGIVLAKEEGVLNAGCTVMVEKVLEMYPDGRMDILTCGQRRFEIVERLVKPDRGALPDNPRNLGAKKKWWLFIWPRPELYRKASQYQKCFAAAATTK